MVWGAREQGYKMRENRLVVVDEHCFQCNLNLRCFHELPLYLGPARSKVDQQFQDARVNVDGRAAASQQQKELAAPLLSPGYSVLAQANQGRLTATNQQAFQAMQARLAQSQSRSGGVGAVQTAISEADLRQRLLANQQSMALNLLGPANAQLAAAIQSELSGTTQGISTRLNMSQQANQAAAGVYQSLATIMAAGLK